MPQPQPEPHLLVSDNCPECGGYGQRQNGPAKIDCEECEGSGRTLTSMPLSMVWEMAQGAHARVTAPPPSALREQALRDS